MKYSASKVAAMVTGGGRFVGSRCCDSLMERAFGDISVHRLMGIDGSKRNVDHLVEGHRELFPMASSTGWRSLVSDVGQAHRDPTAP